MLQIFGSVATGLPNILKIYNYNNLDFTDVSSLFFEDKSNEMDFYSQETWVRYFDLDNDGYKDLVPRFLLEDPNAVGEGSDYPGNAYTNDWNNSKGFQYFKYYPNEQKFKVIDLGVIDKIELGNIVVNQCLYNNFDFMI